MDKETIIKLAREAGFSTGKRSEHIYGFDRDGDYTEELEHFAKLVAEHEREAVIALLKGIDETEVESPDGWWETSTGAEFGASILAAIRARGNT